MKTRPARAPAVAERPLWDLYLPATPCIDAILACPRPLYEAQRRVTADHMRALMARGVPGADMVRGGLLTFGVVRIQGREMIVTDDPRLRAYLHGPGLFAMVNRGGDR